MTTMKVTNSSGRTFAIRVVQKGEAYGLDRCLTHDKSDPLIEVYDATYAGRPGFDRALGQFVSRYYASTLAERKSGEHGINLDGGVPVWQIDAEAWAPVIRLAHRLVREALGHGGARV